MPTPAIRLRGARAHNLKNIDLDLPLGTWIALTGPSGSGKTTLAFDILHREGQRRYLGSLSTKARHYLAKLGRAEVDQLTGLPVTLATGQGALTPSPRSTVGTLVGLLDLLRLLFARRGYFDGDVALSRSHFSFNQAVGACPSCAGLGVEDQVHPPLLVADASKSIRDGALKPTLSNGYTVYSQVTLEVMNTLCQAHGFDVHTPWTALTDDQRQMVLYGTQVMKVPFGKHGIESRMKWKGITARPREEGYYRGLIPVIQETLKRDRNPNILRFVRSIACTSCDGTRLGKVGRETTLGAQTLPKLLATPVRDLGKILDELPTSQVLSALRPALDQRLRRMDQLALGHLSLDRSSTQLSGGEGQRLRLAAQLNAQLSGLLIILDEPTLGLHPSAQQGMAEILEELRDLGNTLLVVDHDPHMVQRADHWLALGPGAGPLGGRVLHNATLPPKALVHSYPQRSPTLQGPGTLHLSGARLHNLHGVDLSVPLAAMTVVSGPSGAGKSSLVFQTLLPALQGVEGGAFSALEGVPERMAVQWVDAKPIGRTPRSTPATYTGLFDLVRKRFAATQLAKALSFGASRFSYNTKAGRCPHCEGLGIVRVGLHLLQDVEQACPSCHGLRYDSEILEVRLNGLHIGAVLDLTVDQAVDFFANDKPILALCQAMSKLGLGYLHLGQSSSTLSRGEAQRVKLATLLGKPAKNASLVLLDEPDRGLHPDDIRRLLDCLTELVQAGNTVLAISHHPMVWHGADHRFALRDGRSVTPSPLPMPPPTQHRTPKVPPTHIELRGVSTHNLKNLDIRIQHGQITAITGVSGSGKSSLAFDTLAALSWSRFAESLPFQVRRFIRQQAAPDLDSAHGLTPVLALKQGQGRAGARATVGSLTDLDADLRLLWSRIGTVEDQPTSLSAAHFSANQSIGACPDCAGLGEVQRCDPDRLISHPDCALTDGAMATTKPGAFFGEADGQYMATLRFAAESAGLDVSPPFSALSPEARALALYGAGDTVFDVTWNYKRGNRSGTHRFKGPWTGLCALVEHEAKVRAKRKNATDWSAPLSSQDCSVCRGDRLHEDARGVQVGTLTLPQLLRRSLVDVAAWLDTLQVNLVQQPVLDAVRPSLLARIRTLSTLGLGHLSPSRRSPTLSTGERQRLRLAGVLDSELRGITLVLDEPGTGLPDAALATLSHRLRQFRDQGNTVVLVAHRQTLIDGADHVLTLGPGAGDNGGRLVAAATGAPAIERSPLGEHGWVEIVGACAHTLKDLDIRLPDRGLVALTGPSGSGKSTLLFDVIGASAAAGRPVGCAQLAGLDRFTERHLTRATPVRTPLTSLGLLKPIQALFHGVGSGLSRSAFSFHSAAGRCPKCKGTGQDRVAMDFMADLVLPCPVCHGARFKAEVLEVRWRGLNIAEFLAAPVSSLLPKLPKGPLHLAIEALVDVGLSHLSLGRPGHVLSGGEHQRVALAAAVANPDGGPALFLLDEPGSGLHGEDLTLLIGVLDRLAQRGSLVVYTTHRSALVAAADGSVALGPGGGTEGGRLVASCAKPALRPPQ